MICWSLLGVRRTSDCSSLSSVRSSCCIAPIGLNLIGAVGSGKKARKARSKSRLTKLFGTGRAWVSVEAVHAVLVAWEGMAAAGAAMVERGGSVIDPRRLHVAKPTRVKMTFYFAEYQNFWTSKRLNCCPRSKWLIDLQQQIAQWQEEGNNIVLLADMNDDVLSKEIQKFCHELNLVEAISMLHGKSPVPTHQRGSKVIDGIYVSLALMEEVEGGILTLGSVTNSDHRAIWLHLSV